MKGIDQILYLIASEKEFALMVIGDGKELPKLLQLAKKLKITERCFFCGFRNNAANYFRHYDFFIVPSRSEGFGLTLIEAVQQKVPVICSDLAVFNELLNADEVTFFKLNDKVSLASAFKTAKETGKTKADLAHARYKNEYNFNVMATKYYKLYQSA
jgi:glycosyltransferase involved in cell wall biosynthesis